MDANFALAHYSLALAYNETGKHAEAVLECEKVQRLSGGSLEMTAVLGYSQALAGNRKEAEKILEELQEVLPRRYVSSYSIALIYLVLGYKEQAFEYLERAFEEKAYYMSWLKVDPRLDPLRTEPRFVSLLQKMGFGK
jgi:tetratricopeptide (TPR) repeat protein